MKEMKKTLKISAVPPKYKWLETQAMKRVLVTIIQAFSRVHLLSGGCVKTVIIYFLKKRK